MRPHMQNPGWRAGVSRDQLGCCSRSPFTATDWQAQFIASRCGLPPSMAREVARHCFGEGCGND